MHRQGEFRRQRHEDTAARGAVELGHHQPGHADRFFENLDLRQSVLPDGGVKDEQHRMRRRGVDFLDDADDLLQFFHQFGAVLQPAGGIDQQNVGPLLFGRREGVENKAGRIGCRRRAP